MMLSVIIPAYMEPYLEQTVGSLTAASGLGRDLEVIVVLDGPWLRRDPEFLMEDRRVRVVQLLRNSGMRAAINEGLRLARGKYVMKVDAHCAFAPGFDKVMVGACEDAGWLVIPRRYHLDEGRWTATRVASPRDHHYLHYPAPGEYLAPFPYTPEQDTDETMCFQGSCWLAHRESFMGRVGLLDDRDGTYGTFAAEQLEVGLKYWLGGGAVKLVRNTWYAHLHKNPRHYATGEYARKHHQRWRGWAWSTRHWMNDEEPGMVRPFSWLIERFWPVPGWPEDRGLWRAAEAA